MFTSMWCETIEEAMAELEKGLHRGWQLKGVTHYDGFYLMWRR